MPSGIRISSGKLPLVTGMTEVVMLETKGLNKTYGQGRKAVHAVRDVDLKLGRGERVYIHGPSGAGKSTLLHLMGALSRPSKGEVIFEGRDIYRMGDVRRSRLRNRSFAFVFQFYHLLPELNVLENIMLPARMAGSRSLGKVQESANELLDRIMMSQRKRHRPGQLSGGEAQRVAIARALINDPHVLFCDEPTGNLDSAMSDEIYRLILRISEEKKMSVVVVSHQDIVEGFYHTEYYMKDGVLSAKEIR